MKNLNEGAGKFPNQLTTKLICLFEEFVDNDKRQFKTDDTAKEIVKHYSSIILNTNGPISLFATLRLIGKEISDLEISYKTIKEWQKIIYSINIELGLLLKLKNHINIKDTCNCIYHNNSNQLEFPLICEDNNGVDVKIVA